MSAIVKEVRKSANFSVEKPFVVVRYGKKRTGKFAIGALGESDSYSLTYNLQLVYPEMVDEDGVFTPNEAYKTFKKELPVGSEEDVNLYDIPVSEISPYKAVEVQVTINGKTEKREMGIMRPACYGSREDALRIAKASLERQIRKKTAIPVKSDEGDEADED